MKQFLIYLTYTLGFIILCLGVIFLIQTELYWSDVAKERRMDQQRYADLKPGQCFFWNYSQGCTHCKKIHWKVVQVVAKKDHPQDPFWNRIYVKWSNPYNPQSKKNYWHNANALTSTYPSNTPDTFFRFHHRTSCPW